MSNPSVESFFENTGGGAGAPSASLKVVDDYVYGEIVDQAMVDAKKFGTDEIERDKYTNEPIKQLVVILQTDLRNYSGVAKLPKNEDGTEKAQSEDDGRRAVYVKPFTNIHAAVGDAIVAATGKKGPLQNGGKLGVKVVELKDTGKGNPLKIHAAKYEPPSASSAVFGEQAPAQEPQHQAPPVQTPATPTPAVTHAVAPAQPAAQGDPWGTPAPAAGNGPPF